MRRLVVAVAFAAAALASAAGRAEDAPKSDADCLERPEVNAYLEYIDKRVYSRWIPPADAAVDSRVKLRFSVDASGAVTAAEVAQASNDAVGKSAVDALRAAAPFDPMSERVRCIAGLSHLTRLLANELAPRVRVNALAVGAVETSALAPFLKAEGMREKMESLTPLRRIGQVEDIAAAALWLVSDASAWVTGKVVEVDGGQETSNFPIKLPDV